LEKASNLYGSYIPLGLEEKLGLDELFVEKYGLKYVGDFEFNFVYSNNLFDEDKTDSFQNNSLIQIMKHKVQINPSFFTNFSLIHDIVDLIGATKFKFYSNKLKDIDNLDDKLNFYNSSGEETRSRYLMGGMDD